MLFHRCVLTLALALSGTLGALDVARAEVILLLTTRQVIAVDLADTTVVSRYSLPNEVGASVKGIDGGAPVLVADQAGRRVWSVGDDFRNALPAFDLPAVNAEGIVRLDPPLRPAGVGPIGSELVVVNGQAPMVPPDTLFVLEEATGVVVARFPMPAGANGLKDLAFDGEDLWSVDTSSGGRLWRIDPATGAFEESFPLPGSPTFAVAWNAVASELWLFQSPQGVDVVGYTVDRTTGGATEVLRLPEDSTTFVLAAAFTDVVTPVDVSTWGALKQRFAR
jgi:hypothetical protein